MIKYTLYIGLNDQHTKNQEISTLEAFKIVQNILSDKTGGGTVYNATGIYKHDNGEIVIENTLRVEIVAAPLEMVQGAIRVIKSALNQEAVILQTENIESVLV